MDKVEREYVKGVYRDHGDGESLMLLFKDSHNNNWSNNCRHYGYPWSEGRFQEYSRRCSLSFLLPEEFMS